MKHLLLLVITVATSFTYAKTSKNIDRKPNQVVDERVERIVKEEQKCIDKATTDGLENDCQSTAVDKLGKHTESLLKEVNTKFKSIHESDLEFVKSTFEKTQENFEAYVKSQCDLWKNTIVGTSKGLYQEYQCTEEKYISRINELNEMNDYINKLKQKN